MVRPIFIMLSPIYFSICSHWRSLRETIVTVVFVKQFSVSTILYINWESVKSFLFFINLLYQQKLMGVVLVSDYSLLLSFILLLTHLRFGHWEPL
jgi:hypothetical protein